MYIVPLSSAIKKKLSYIKEVKHVSPEMLGFVLFVDPNNPKISKYYKHVLEENIENQSSSTYLRLALIASNDKREFTKEMWAKISS